MSAYHDIQQISDQMKAMLPRLNEIRDAHRSQYNIGRELSLAFTHLEDAITRAGKAQQWIVHGIQDEAAKGE
jgi:hypothetical protein